MNKEGMNKSSKLFLTMVSLIVASLILGNSESKSEMKYTDPRDHHIYQLIQIGDLLWFDENLSLTTNTSVCYDSLDENCLKYGQLYSFKEAQSICPEFWRLPTQHDVEKLHEIMGTKKINKIASPGEWKVKKAGKFDNSIGLSVLPSGRIDSITYFSNETSNWISTVAFHQLGIAASFWLKENETEDGLIHWHVGDPIGEIKSGVHRHGIFPEIHKFSVRCVCEKDEIE